MPKNLSLKDVVFNTSRGALLIAAFCCQDYPLLKQTMEDKTHQLYIGKMIHAVSEVLEVALEATAHGSCLSGSDLLLSFFAKKKIL
ncbi:MAG: hypothetical protein LE180_03790 [Endomicrobium sp.]|uniref:hypothetical protein n=1 Tax=Candidatus Endomicrobiellum pyrsonymphae TaxID=1408203 RepID=UPI0035892C96|nr:hypothetical protein [Endomicrobium sp.]